MKKFNSSAKFLILFTTFILSAKVISSENLESLARAYEKHSSKISPESLNSLDTFKLLDQKVIEPKVNLNRLSPREQEKDRKRHEKFTRLIKPSQIDVNLFSQDGRFERSVSINDPYVGESDISRLQLSFQGRVFHELTLKASQVAIFNQTLFLKTAEGIFFLDIAEFKHSLGKSEIPIFKLPFSKKLLKESMLLKDGVLKLGKINVTKELVKIYSDAQKIAFRITSNMVDPNFHGEILPVLESFKRYFKLVLDKTGQGLETQAESVKLMSRKIVLMQERIKADLNRQRDLLAKDEKLTEEKRKELLSKYSKQAVERLEKDLLSQNELKDKFEAVNKNISPQRKMTTRLHWIWARMSMPTPDAAKKIKKALEFVKATLVYENIKDMKSTVNFLSDTSKKGVKLAGFTALAYMSMRYQVEIAQFMYQSLDMTKAVINSVFGELNTIKNVGYTAAEASKSTAHSYNPFTVVEAYGNAEILPKLGIGLTAIISSLYIIIGTPHIAINSIELYKDLKKEHFQKFYDASRLKGNGHIKSKANAFFQTFFHKEHFVQRQRRFNNEYLQILAKAHSQASESGSTEYTEADDKEIEKIVEELEKNEKKRRGFVTRFIGKANILKFLNRNKNLDSNDKIAPKQETKEKSKDIDNFRKALGNFLLSYAAWTRTGYIYTTIWNKWFVFRSFVLRPSTWYTFLAYPKYYDKIVKPVKNVDIQMPTKFNGGTQSRFDFLDLDRLKPAVRNSELLREGLLNFVTKVDKKKLAAWEGHIFSIEERVHNEAIKKAFKALSENIQKDSHLKELLEAGNIKTIFDKRVGELKKKQQIYFQNVFQVLFNRSMERILKQANLTDGNKAFHIQDINRLTVEDINRLKDITDIERIVQQEWYQNKRYITQEAELKVKDSFLRPSLNKMRSSMATERVKSTNKHGANPIRMAQSVRYMIAKNLVDKPMELLFMFVGLAAIQSSGLGQDLIRPIQDAMFSENSWFYLSRYSLLNGYLIGVVMGVMADVWYKLQIGENQKNDFGTVPTGKDLKSSYLRWYFKTLNSQDNGWWNNQKHFIKIVYANMPAAIVTYMTFNFITLGRFDVDAYVIGYLAAYLLPTNGLNFKLENGFELASGYFYKDIPEKFRSHKLAQEYANKLAHKKRLVFNLFYTTYENVLGTLIFTMESMETEKLGSRSLSRSIFGGWTITEKVAETAEKVKVGIEVSNLPGKDGLTKLVDMLCKPITNNFTDWSKFTPKD